MAEKITQQTVYNASNIIGMLAVSVGVGLLSVPFGIVSFGLLMIGINVFNLIMIKGK